MISIDPHSLLEARCVVTRWPRRLEACTTQAFQARPPLELTTVDEVLRQTVRDLLRQAGFKPTGRSKPASEYLLKISEQDEGLQPINAAVDVCNVVSLYSGLPMSVVCAEKAQGPFRIGVASAEYAHEYIFNASGQSMNFENLLCLFDSQGPCANPVKDSQRTKTTPDTTSTLSIIWGTKALPGRSDAALQWYRQLLVAAGCAVETW
jgi:DNA/RNA-binding domain of Phe-tRNA-synthetase-like protein